MAKLTLTREAMDVIVLGASMYAEYTYLKDFYMSKHWKLFGVKQELVDTVEANIDYYSTMYAFYCNVNYKKGYRFIRLIPWNVLLYNKAYMDKNLELKMYPTKKK